MTVRDWVFLGTLIILGVLVYAGSPSAKQALPRFEVVRTMPGQPLFLSGDVSGFNCDQGQCYVLVKHE